MEFQSPQTYRTLQGYDLTKFTGPIKPNLGFGKNNKILSEAKQILYKIIGEDQVVWWGQYTPTLFSQHIDSFVHEIHKKEIDPQDILAVIDTFIWNHLIGNSRYIPEKVHNILRHRAEESKGDHDESLQYLEDKYLEENLPPKDQWWSAVIKGDISNDSDDLLTKFPMFPKKYSRIIKITRVKKHMVKYQHNTTN